MIRFYWVATAGVSYRMNREAETVSRVNGLARSAYDLVHHATSRVLSLFVVWKKVTTAWESDTR